MNVLVTGGAGYVGSHAVRRLKEQGHTPVILDNLSRGHRKAAELLEVPLVVADLADRIVVERVLRERKIELVMHFAAYAYVGESVEQPLAYYRNNVALTVSLLEAMHAASVHRLVFSSSCAVYGIPQRVPIVEGEPKNPLSPYGRSKLMIEQVLADYARANPDFRYAALRYFNAAGCSGDGLLGEDHRPETHLIPLVLQAASGQISAVTILGHDYPTPDGTAIRDYIHVDDLARAHSAAVDVLDRELAIECNLGTGRGFSVAEVIAAAERVTGRPTPTVHGPRRPGDAPALFADASHAKELLRWEAEYRDLDRIIETAWRWHTQHPSGYEP